MSNTKRKNGSNIVGLDGQPLNAKSISKAKRNNGPNIVDRRLAERLRDADPFKLQNYCDSLLEFDDPRRLNAFVLDRPALLREWADLLLDEADTLEAERDKPSSTG